MEKQNIFIMLGLALFSMFGSSVKWLYAKDRGQQSSLVYEIAGAAFGGLLVYFVSTYMQWDTNLTFALAGICGFGGAVGIDRVAGLVLKHSGVSELETSQNNRLHEDRS